MHVILTEDVMGVGDIGAIVSVRRGFARNFLIPRGLAFETGASNAKTIAHKMRHVEAKKNKLRGAAELQASRMNSLTIQLTLRVGSGGRVFGSVTSRDIADQLVAQGFEIDRRRVLLSDSLRKVGTHYVEIKIHPEVKAQIRVDIQAAQATADEEETETKMAKEAIEQAVSTEQSGETIAEGGEVAKGSEPTPAKPKRTRRKPKKATAEDAS